MRLLVLSLCRTSEIPLGQALKHLGYKPFGMAEGMKNPGFIYRKWHEAAQAKYSGVGKSWGRKEFDAMLSEYDTVLSLPGCLYAEELVAAYPDAKVILMTRSTESWVQTMRVAGGEMLTWRGWGIMQRWDSSFSGALITLIQAQMPVMCNGDFSPGGYAARKFEEHNDLVRRLVPKENLLEYDARDGWEPVCEFLGHEKPRGIAFPALDADDDDDRIVRFQKAFWYIGMVRALGKVAGIFIGVPWVLGYAWFRQTAIRDVLTDAIRKTGHFQWNLLRK